MPYQITNIAGFDLRIGHHLIKANDSYIIGEIDGLISGAVARRHVSAVFIPLGGFNVQNNANSDTYVGDMRLEPGQTTYFDKLPDNADGAFKNGTLKYTYAPTPAGALAPGVSSGTSGTSGTSTATFIAVVSGAQFIPLSLTTSQSSAGFSFYINGLLQRMASNYQVSIAGITITSSLNVIAGDLIDFQYSQ